MIKGISMVLYKAPIMAENLGAEIRARMGNPKRDTGYRTILNSEET